MRDQRKSDQRARFVASSVIGPAMMGASLFPVDTGLPDRVRALVEAWHDAHPHDPGASVEQAAFHEAGHFVTAEALGMVATKAEIHGSRFGRGGWGGSAGALERPLLERSHWSFTGADVEKEAAFTFAGPMAEHVFAVIGAFAPQPWKRGRIYAALGEILEGCTIVAKLADLRKDDRSATLHSVLANTARIVFTFDTQIEQIATSLQSRHRISRYDRCVKKAFDSIARSPLRHLTTPSFEHSEIARQIIDGAPIDLARFTEEVGR